MTNEEYINQHPEQFKDESDKWLFTEFGIMGGCCSAEKSHEYSIARMVADKLNDAFIEKALKWYCRDCDCNDNCKDIKRFFYREYERYLKGEANAIPPKFSDRIINEDGSISDNWRYRHFIKRMQDAFIEKAEKYLLEHLIDYWSQGVTDESGFIEDFKNYMKGE